MHEPPGELEGTLDRVQSILTLHTHALCERTQGHTADPNEPVNRREEPGAAASCFFPPGRMQAPGEPPPPPLPLGSKLRLPGSQLSPAEAPHRAGRKPAARTAAAMVEAHERLRPSSLPTACRDCSPSTGRGPRPETESPSPGAAPQRRPDWGGVRTGSGVGWIRPRRGQPPRGPRVRTQGRGLGRPPGWAGLAPCLLPAGPSGAKEPQACGPLTEFLSLNEADAVDSSQTEMRGTDEHEAGSKWRSKRGMVHTEE